MKRRSTPKRCNVNLKWPIMKAEYSKLKSHSLNSIIRILLSNIKSKSKRSKSLRNQLKNLNLTPVIWHVNFKMLTITQLKTSTTLMTSESRPTTNWKQLS